METRERAENFGKLLAANVESVSAETVAVEESTDPARPGFHAIVPYDMGGSYDVVAFVKGQGADEYGAQGVMVQLRGETPETESLALLVY